VYFSHAECNFHPQFIVETHKCGYDTYDRDFNTHKSDFYTQSVMLTRISVIKCDTHEIDYDKHTCYNHTLRVEITLVCDEYTHECNF
jgi:hypothetical protein